MAKIKIEKSRVLNEVLKQTKKLIRTRTTSEEKSELADLEKKIKNV